MSDDTKWILRSSSHRALIRGAGWPSSPAEDTPHPTHFFCFILVINTLHKPQFVFFDWMTDTWHINVAWSLYLLDLSFTVCIWVDKHFLLCHYWKETLLVTNTEAQGTTEHAPNSSHDIVATPAHGGRTLLWNLRKYLKMTEFIMSDWTEERRFICFSHSSSCLETNVCVCVCV